MHETEHGKVSLRLPMLCVLQRCVQLLEIAWCEVQAQAISNAVCGKYSLTAVKFVGA